jgi:hypothetical protein
MCWPRLEIVHEGHRIGMQGTAPYHIETPGYVIIICDRNGFDGVQFLDSPGSKCFGFNAIPECVQYAQAVCDALNLAAEGAALSFRERR